MKEVEILSIWSNQLAGIGQQTREKTVVMIRDEDHLTSAIFELDVRKKSV